MKCLVIFAKLALDLIKSAFYNQFRPLANGFRQKNEKNRQKIFGHFSPLGSPPGTPHISAKGSNFENRFGQYVFYA